MAEDPRITAFVHDLKTNDWVGFSPYPRLCQEYNLGLTTVKKYVAMHCPAGARRKPKRQLLRNATGQIIKNGTRVEQVQKSKPRVETKTEPTNKTRRTATQRKSFKIPETPEELSRYLAS